MKNKLVALPYIIWMFLFIVAPLIIVVFYAFTNANGEFTFSNIVNLREYVPTFLSSIWMGALAAFISLLIGYPTAYFISKAGERTQKMLVMLVMLPMFMSFLLRTIALVSLMSNNGLINSFINMIGLEKLSLIRNTPAVIVGMVYIYLPYMIIPLYNSLSRMDKSILEAAEDLGANRFQRFRRVVFPLSVPGVVSGITMVFVPAVSTFYISKKLGGISDVMIGDIIEQQFKQAYNPYMGAAMALGLLVLISVCMAIMRKFSGDDEEEILL